MEGLLLQILEKLGNIEADISELKAKKCNIETDISDIKQSISSSCQGCPWSLVGNKVSVEKQKTTKELQYGDNIQELFDVKDVQYDANISVKENLNKLCSEIDESIRIYAGDNVVYDCEKQYKFPVNYKIDKKAVTLMNSQFTNSWGSSTSELIEQGTTKEDYAECCRLLQLGKHIINKRSICVELLKNTYRGLAIEKLTDEEMYVLDKARGNVAYLRENNYHIENAYSYDINSFHPYVLGCSDFEFPLRTGKCVNLQTIDSSVPGMYAIAIKDPIKYFIQAAEEPDKVWHSHYMIQLLEQEGIKYKPMITKEYNAIIYNKSDMVKTREIFGNNIKVLYNNRNNKVCKSVAQELIGVHTWKNKTNRTVNKDDIDFNTFANGKTISDNGNTMVRSEDGEDNGYRFPCARIKMFFYDYCRMYLFNKYLKKYDPVRIATDSILIEEDLDDDDYDELNDEIGGIKPELRLKNVVYENVTFSYKNKENHVKGVYMYDKVKEKYVPTWK